MSVFYHQVGIEADNYSEMGWI